MLAPAPISLSKSKILAGMQCLKRLYWQVRRPDLAEAGEPASAARLEQGREVGLLAQRMLPEGRSADFDGEMAAALAETAALIANPSIPAVFEAVFRHAGVLVQVDILERLPRNRWRLLEVKSALDVKPQYLDDLAVQRYVVSACGLDVVSAQVVLLNREYRYDGVEYDLGSLFIAEDVTADLAPVAESIPELIERQREALAADAAPEIAPGDQCSDPYRCEFFKRCNSEPPENHVSLLPRLSEKKRQQLDEQRITLIHEIPEDFPLTETQSHVWTAVRTGRAWVSEGLADALTGLEWPLCFMDFESLYPALPRYVGMWPYAQIPFQWSVHRQAAPGSEIEHYEFLAEDEHDPRPAFIESLAAAVGDSGSIVVYNSTYESGRLTEIAARLPEYADRIDRIRERLWDMLPVVRKHLYHPKFNGAFSIKSVLPALVPEMSYEGMEVANGEAAGLAWDQMMRDRPHSTERRRLKSALLAYCGQDTFAMVRLLEALKTLAARPAGAGTIA